MRKLVILAIILLATAANAQQLFKLDDIHSGTLLVKTTQPGIYASAPAVATDVHLRIRGLILRGEVTQKDLDTEREIARDQAAKSGKPENIVEKMVSGKMEKFYAEACLLEQPYIRNDKQSVGDHLKSQATEAGCEYTVTRFVRYKLGEGIEKKSDDFAAEVASYMK